MNQLENLITGALKHQNNAFRAQSETKLIQLRESNPCQFLIICSRILNDEAKTEFMRQSSGTVLGRSAITKNLNGMFFWDFLTPEMKNEIRDNVINTLISNNQNIVNIGASTMSQIAAIQISRGNWLDLIDIFAQNVQHNQFSVRRASITAIGFICQQLKSINAKVNQRSCQQLLGSIIVGSREKSAPAIVEAAYKALRNSISFLNPILQITDVRNEAFKIISQNLGNTQNSRILYQALFQFSKQCYEFLGEYLHQLIIISELHLGQKNQLSILNLQLWDTIGQEYNERIRQSKIRIQQQNNSYNIIIPNFLQAVRQKLYDSIIRCILIYNSDDLDQIQLRQSAVKTLGTFVEAGDRTIIQAITQSVSGIIGSQNPGQRQASTLIFSALCQSHDQQFVKASFTNGFQYLFRLLSDNEKIVVHNSLIGFKRLLEVFPEIVMWNANHKGIMEKLLSLIQSQDRQICLESLAIICSISDGLSKDKESLMSKDLQYIFKAVVSYYERNLLNFHHEFKEGNQKIILIIINLVTTTNRRDILLQLIEFSLNKYYSLGETNLPDIQQMLNGIISIIHTCLLALRNMPNELSLMNQICQLTNYHIQRFGVDQQSLSLISALAISFNRMFEPRLNEYWESVIIGIGKTNDLAVFKAALSTAGDIARSFESNFCQRGKMILDQLFRYIHENIGLQQKIAILTCMGDLILALKELAQGFIETILKISNECFEAVYEMQKDPNSQELAQELKQALIQMYACMVFAMNSNGNCNDTLAQHYRQLGCFIVKTCDPTLNPTVSYLKLCLFLLFDCACFYSNSSKYKSTVLQITQSDEVQRLISIIKEVKNKSDVSQLISLIQSSKSKFGLK